MIREWLVPDGTVKRFDTVTRTVYSLSPTGEIVVPVHDATEEEIIEYKQNFPEATQEELAAKASVLAQLGTVLVSLRNASSDFDITDAEFAAINPMVISSLSAYRDLPFQDAEVDKAAFLVLTQVAFAYSILLAKGAGASRLMMNTILNFEQRISSVESRITALETP